MKTLLVTGSSGLIGSEVCKYFSRELGHRVYGLDNNQRAVFFGAQGDTRWNQQRLQRELTGFTHHELDIRDRAGVLELIKDLRPNVIVHTAAQPSHDLAAAIPFDDFDTNAVGTLNLLEAARQFCPESPFIHMSTNKVYGDAPNRIAMKELETRWDYDDPSYENGIPETLTIDQSKHSLFGASKIAADVMVGFPTETEADHARSKDLLKSAPVTYLHVFPYSPRPGTPSAQLRPEVPGRAAQRRSLELRELGAEKNLQFRTSFLSKRLSVITLDRKEDGEKTQALSTNYLKVELEAKVKPNQLVEVLVKGMTTEGVKAESEE